MRHASRLAPWIVAGACACITIVVFYPGQYPFDSAYQLWQARTGQFGNGSPVAMIALWSLLLRASANPATLFCLNVAMFWSGLALCVAAITEHALARVALLLAFGMTPLALAEMAHVLTDAHLAAVLVLATGFAAWGLTSRRRVALVVCVVLLIYAGWVRHNALVAILPYGALVAPALLRTRSRGFVAAVSCALGLTVLSAASAWVLDRALVVQRFTVWPSIALWDLAAISVDRNILLLPSFTHGRGLTVDELRETGAFDPAANTFLFQKSRSGVKDGLLEAYTADQLRELRAAWIDAVRRFPMTYALHRLRTFRLLIGSHRGDIQGMAYFNTRTQYLDNPALPEAVTPRIQAAFYRMAGALSSGWIFSALPYLMLAIAAWIIAWRRRRQPVARVALAVSGAALLYAAGYFPLAPAADLRYLTWPIIAGPLALGLALSKRALSRKAEAEHDFARAAIE